jgi:hypothetical protein
VRTGLCALLLESGALPLPHYEPPPLRVAAADGHVAAWVPLLEFFDALWPHFAVTLLSEALARLKDPQLAPRDAAWLVFWFHHVLDHLLPGADDDTRASLAPLLCECLDGPVPATRPVFALLQDRLAPHLAAGGVDSAAMSQLYAAATVLPVPPTVGPPPLPAAGAPTAMPGRPAWIPSQDPRWPIVSLGALPGVPEPALGLPLDTLVASTAGPNPSPPARTCTPPLAPAMPAAANPGAGGGSSGGGGGGGDGGDDGEPAGKRRRATPALSAAELARLQASAVLL